MQFKQFRITMRYKQPVCWVFHKTKVVVEDHMAFDKESVIQDARRRAADFNIRDFTVVSCEQVHPKP